MSKSDPLPEPLPDGATEAEALAWLDARVAGSLKDLTDSANFVTKNACVLAQIAAQFMRAGRGDAAMGEALWAINASLSFVTLSVAREAVRRGDYTALELARTAQMMDRPASTKDN